MQEDETPIPILYIDERDRGDAARPARGAAPTRDNDRVRQSLDALRDAARGHGNTMYPLLECVRAYATVGEMCDALRDVWGEYEEVPLI